MDSADGSILSKQSTVEMGKNQHQMTMVPTEADTVFLYGLGWDSVETYPFTEYGIKALSKGGGTSRYHSNLTVLPEYNLAVAVASSGAISQEQIIAQEILLGVLREEGLLPEDMAAEIPQYSLEPARIPESVKSYAGIYTAGFMGQFSVEFTDTSLILTPIMVRNERPQEYIYNTSGQFVSTNQDFVGLNASVDGVQGTMALSFAGDKYLTMQSHENLPGLGVTAAAIPFAQKVEDHPVSASVTAAWAGRNEKEYLLVNEKHTSFDYIGAPIAKTLADARTPGYVGAGLYAGRGKAILMAKITNDTTALGFQDIPTMLGRDTNNLTITVENDVEYLHVNLYRYMDASAAVPFSALGESVVISGEPIWVNVDDSLAGKVVAIDKPENGSWFVYDDDMNCIATSLEKNLRGTIILPKGGRLAFVGDPGAEFGIHEAQGQ
jgi:hypothetical protein